MRTTAGGKATGPQQVVSARRRTNADLQRELDQALAERDEAQARETATAEVLRVINASPGDLGPVFDAILQKAHDLCDAALGSLVTFDGTHFRALTTHGYPEQFAALMRRPFLPSIYHRPVLEGERFVHLQDFQAVASGSDHEVVAAVVRQVKARSFLAVPLRKDGVLLGLISATRLEVRPFSDKEIALLESFAVQAVIAMENARLLTETREALEQQTATAEVLGVINSSPGDLAPVFDAILDKAHGLCGAVIGILTTFDGEHFHAVATHGLSEEFSVSLRQAFRTPLNSPQERLIKGADFVQIPDLADESESLWDRSDPIREVTLSLGIRALLWIPLRKDGTLLGYLSADRLEPRPFNEKEIVLLQNFASQAVIAMENARLLGELRQRTGDLEEALEYQTATSNVLQVISRSTFDLQPVLDTLVETAARLCSAEVGQLTLREGEAYRAVATHALSAEYDAFIRGHEHFPGRGSLTGRIALEGRAIHIADFAADPDYELPQAGKLRTALGVPLLRDGVVIGTINFARSRVEPFTERQIDLVRTFADQAVIAIENTRLLTELRESLEQQQAMAEVLQVINSSPGDLAPVFDAMLQKAMKLCDAPFGGLIIPDGEFARYVALRNAPSPYAEYLTSEPTRMTTLLGRAFLADPSVVQIDDLSTTEGYRRRVPLVVAGIELGGARTVLFVPLLKDATLVGVLTIYRQEVRPFTSQQIALLQSFAAQAVIAMDNARLLNEIRQRQAELRVTFDNMGDGVAMFDADLRLAAWNRNFQTLLDLPDDLVTSQPSFAEYFNYLAGRGEYGDSELEAQIRSGLEDSRQDNQFERTRPNGRVIEVRRNVVPGGGFVLIYGDVTERKRAEAEIHAARDAAEKALGELKAAQANLIQAEKMASLGQLTAGIAHEIKNPLNFVNNFAGLSVELLDELKEDAVSALAALDDDKRANLDDTMEMLTSNLDKIAEHGRRADNIVTSMLEHSRGVSGERREVDLNALVDEALNLAYHGARAQDQSFNITMERDFASALNPIELAPQEMTRVFLNLIGNGFYAANKRAKEDGNGSFRPVLSVATRDDGNEVEVKIRDNGTGIPPEVNDKLFQPFFTTKPTGEGTGLGLSISYDIVTQQHGGTIEVDSEPGSYTEFVIRLPRR